MNSNTETVYTTDADAAALSVYVHALAEHSAGDAPGGRPLRSWFADASRFFRETSNHARQAQDHRFRHSQ